MMAAGAKSAPVTNGTHATNKPIERAISLPNSPGTRIYLHLTVLTSSVMLFLTSTSVDAGQSGAAMGSFVYAMPDVRNTVDKLGPEDLLIRNARGTIQLSRSVHRSTLYRLR